MKSANTYEEIKPFVDLCKAGRLFEVQKWIASGNPVNLPLVPEKGGAKQSPLHIAMEMGFHSLVEVLLDAGAAVEEQRYSPLEHAVRKRRLDLVKLLVEKGAIISSIDIRAVFEGWNPGMVDYFIENGADLETGNPVAWALCTKIPPALGLIKGFKDRYPSFQEQANIALRRHCWDGNLKWVSLMLWAGGDPYAKGPDSPEQEPDPESDNSALDIAAFQGNLNIFRMKAIRLDPKREDARGLMENACHAEKSDVLKHLLDKGFCPKDWEDKGSSLIQSLLCRMSFDWDFSPFSGYKKREKDIDTSRSREEIKMIHLLARHGAKWEPYRENHLHIGHARRSLLKMTPDYTVEFVWVMVKYNACSRDAIEELLRPLPIRTLVSKHIPRINELIATLRSGASNEKERKKQSNFED